MKDKILKFVLIFQGLYYFFTGLWAIVALDHFSRFTGLHLGTLDMLDRFEMYSIAGMAVVIGLFFIWSARKEELRKPVGFLALGLVIAILIPEFIYLPQIGNPILFWLDFLEESIIALLLLYAIILLENFYRRL